MPPVPTAQSTRDRILTYLAENSYASAQSLSRAWGLTRADIRYHLNALAADGLIELAPLPSRKPAGRGRPALHYRLKAAAAPHNLDGLCGALIEALLETGGPEGRVEALKRVASRLANGFTAPAIPVHRLNEAVQFLNHRGYRSRWEASASGPRILLRGCPYAALLNDHPEICTIDQHLIETLTGLKLRQDARANLITGTPPACVFSPEWVHD